MTATTDGQTLFDIVVDYTYALNTLDNYDYERLVIERTTTKEPFRATYESAMLLYLVTKNHSFSDGNKRIAATLFLCFLNTMVFFIVPTVRKDWRIIPS